LIESENASIVGGKAKKKERERERSDDRLEVGILCTLGSRMAFLVLVVGLI
jgi:hypothetical protein